MYKPGDNLILAAVGMRRKNLIVLEVDVYLIGLSLSPTALGDAKLWKSQEKTCDPLAEILLQKQTPRSSSNDNEIIVSISLKFVRSVTKPQMVQAFQEALLGCNKDATAEFNEALDRCIDREKGLQKGDVLNFEWTTGGGFVVSSDQHVSREIVDVGLAQRLLEVYVDDSRTVSVDLVKCIRDHVDQIQVA